MVKIIKKCNECGEIKIHYANNLCSRCYQVKWREKNSGKDEIYSKRYRNKHPNKLKEWRSKNPEKHKKIMENFHKNNPKYHNRYQNKRMHNDIKFKNRRDLATTIGKIIKKHKGKKSNKTIKLLGCTINTFMEHIEKQWQDGMTWDNHGQYGWHIDHIKPCASFDLSKEEDQLECFNYKNLQPLWWRDNLEKSAKTQ